MRITLKVGCLLAPIFKHFKMRQLNNPAGSKFSRLGPLSPCENPLKPIPLTQRCLVSMDVRTVLAACEKRPEALEPAYKAPRLEAIALPVEAPLLVKRLSEHAILPVRGSAGAAGYDLASAYESSVPARGKALVKTDLSIRVPRGTYGRVAPRSGLAWKYSIDVGAGVIDEDYTGPVGVILFNHSDTDFAIKKGDRIAQLVLEQIATPGVQEVRDLEATDRGAGGFGSTGVAAVAVLAPAQA